MKIKSEDYTEMKQAIQGVLTAHPEAHAEYTEKGLSETRFRWDLLWVSKFPITRLYAYMNDTHIDTALKAIVKELKA